MAVLGISIFFYPAKKYAQHAEIGMAMTREGSILARGKETRLSSRKPVAKRRKPPTAEKSPIISGVAQGMIKAALKNKRT